MQSSTSQWREPKSAGDLMRQSGLPEKPVDFVTGVVISRRPLNASSRYSYCPYCYKRVKKFGGDFQQVLRPLNRVTYKNLYKIDGMGGAKICFESVLECPVCRDFNGKPLRIGVEDYIASYAAPYREEPSLFLDLNDKAALSRAGFGNFVDFSGEI